MFSPLMIHRHLAVALVSETWPPEINGVAMTLSRLVRGLAERGHRVQVVRPNQIPEDGVRAVDHPRVSELVRAGMAIPRYQSLRVGFPCRGALLRAWTRQRPDVVHIATEGPLGWSALAAARVLDLPVSTSFHTNFDDYSRHYGLGLLHPAVAAYLRWFHGRAVRTLVPSDDLIARLRAAGWRNLARLDRGVDTDLFSPAHRDHGLRRSWGVDRHDHDAPVLLHVGRVAPEKDIPLAIRAWQAVRAARPRARLIVCGDGPLRPQLAAAHPEVLFTGALPVQDLARHYASADLFVFPSRSETFGNVLLEALASGVAAVAFDYAAAKAHLRDGLHGRAVALEDDAGFCAATVALAGDHARCRAFGAEARTAMEAVGWRGVVDRFETNLRQVADTAWPGNPDSVRRAS